MGFLSKLVNKVTGGSAEVDMEMPDRVVRGETVTITSAIEVKDQPIPIEKVVVEIRCSEQVPAIDTNYTDGITPPPTSRRLWEHEVVVAEAQELAAGSKHSFTATIDIPADAVATADKISWMARTRVEMDGNDPDSGWDYFSVV